METKKCIQCGHILPLSEFDEDKRSRDGHRRACKVCLGVHEKREGSSVSVVSVKTGGNPKLSEFKPLDLILELRHRGYHGELIFTKKVVV